MQQQDIDDATAVLFGACDFGGKRGVSNKKVAAPKFVQTNSRAPQHDLWSHYIRKVQHSRLLQPGHYALTPEVDLCSQSNTANPLPISRDECANVCRTLSSSFSYTSELQRVLFKLCVFPQNIIDPAVYCDSQLHLGNASFPFTTELGYGYDGKHCVYPDRESFVWQMYKLRVQDIVLRNYAQDVSQYYTLPRLNVSSNGDDSEYNDEGNEIYYDDDGNAFFYDDDGNAIFYGDDGNEIIYPELNKDKSSSSSSEGAPSRSSKTTTTTTQAPIDLPLEFAEPWCKKSQSLNTTALKPNYCVLYCTHLIKHGFTQQELQHIGESYIHHCSFGSQPVSSLETKLRSQRVPRLEGNALAQLYDVQVRSLIADRVDAQLESPHRPDESKLSHSELFPWKWCNNSTATTDIATDRMCINACHALKAFHFGKPRAGYEELVFHEPPRGIFDCLFGGKNNQHFINQPDLK